MRLGKHAGAVGPATGVAATAPPANDVALVVVTYNSAAEIPDFVASLARGLDGVPRSELVVVDNSSVDGTLEVVARHAPAATVVALPDNRGFAAGINAGFAAAAPARSVLVLNPDVRLSSGCVARMLAALDEPGVGLVGPRILDEQGRTYPSLRREPTLPRALGVALIGGNRAGRFDAIGEVVTDPARYDRPAVAAWATGAVLLVSVACWQAVGAWDESFFLFSEETDFALRAADRGYRLRYVPKAVTVHPGGVSMSREPGMYALLASNRVRLYGKRHGLLATRAYRYTVALHEALRSARGDQAHRAALRVVLDARAERGAELLRSGLDQVREPVA